MTLSVANIVDATEAEGPGVRFAIWFQGCPFRCPGCCNPEMLTFRGGTEMSVADVAQRIGNALENEAIEGITLLGGEPFSHARGASQLAEIAQVMGLSVMVFTGHEFSQLQANPDDDVQSLMEHTDLLVDGLYDRDQPDTTRRWIGSMNQEIHFLSGRYSREDAFWNKPDTLEIRLRDGELAVNGFPAKSAVGVWKRPRKSSKTRS